MTPAVLVFDVNETLLDITALEPVFATVFGDPRIAREWFGQLVTYSMTLTLSDVYTDFFTLGEAVLRMLGDIHGVEITDDDLHAVRDGFSTMPAHVDVAIGLGQLRDKGYRLVTLTNSPPSPGGETPLQRAGLGHFFEQEFSVDAARVYKPAPQLYRDVAERLGVQPSDCMMVAAHTWDTIGAQAAGFSGALIRRQGNAPLPAPGTPQPTVVASDLVDLVRQLHPMGPAVVRGQPGGDMDDLPSLRSPQMRAIVLDGFGGPDRLVYTDIPKPLPKAGEVVIQVKGFGVNHAEMHMRRGEWAEAAEVSGIECVGIVDSCPGGEFPVGAKVAALMGGLGRTINGSYAEYTRVRAANVALIGSDLPWSQLAALPETYATAWTCLFRNLALASGQTIVIRGATSSFGQAAVKMAVNAGAHVIATARSRDRFAMLERLGARVETESTDLASRLADGTPIDAVLDLVGTSTILDSLDMLRRGGSACLAGWLGGLDPIGDFNPLLRMASGVNLSFFGSFVFGNPGFPLSDIPLQEIARQVERGELEAQPSRVFSFDEIREVHRVMEAGEAGGKMVVVID
ncbi:MAG: NADPH:quinone reductase [Mycobacterium sp.]|nr:NADPH:quinone reductase [Mycobacterium sp.]